MKRSHPQSGFSLIEVLVVVAIIAIISTMALITLGSSKVDLQRQGIAREFEVYLERARFDSVKRRAEAPNQASVVLNSASSFTAKLDLDSDGVISPFEIHTVDFTQKSATQILVTDTWNYPVTVTFDRRGHATAVDGLGNIVSPVFTICSNCSSNSPDRSVISLSATGTVSVTRGQTYPSTLPTPAITNPDSSPNCYVYLSGGNTNSSLICPR